MKNKIAVVLLIAAVGTASIAPVSAAAEESSVIVQRAKDGVAPAAIPAVVAGVVAAARATNPVVQVGKVVGVAVAATVGGFFAQLGTNLADRVNGNSMPGPMNSEEILD